MYPCDVVVTPRRPDPPGDPASRTPAPRRDDRNTNVRGWGWPISPAPCPSGGSPPPPCPSPHHPRRTAGRDVCGKAKTGSGKTLAFGLPVLQPMAKAERRSQPGSCSCRPVSSPIRCATNWRPPPRRSTALAIYGGALIEKQIEKLERGVDLVVATPGRMIDLIGATPSRWPPSTMWWSTKPTAWPIWVSSAGRVDPAECRVRSPDAVVLGHARRCGQHLIKRYQTDPSMHEVVSEEVTVEQMTTGSSPCTKWTRRRSQRVSPSRPSARSCSPAPRQWLIGLPTRGARREGCADPR